MTSEKKEKREFIEVLENVATQETDDFIQLTKTAGLDPASDFIGADLRGVDLRHLDLRAYDFTGACMEGALTDGATFQSGMKEKILFESSASDQYHRRLQWRNSDLDSTKQIPDEAKRIIEKIFNESRQENRIEALDRLITKYSSQDWVRPILLRVMAEDRAQKPPKRAWKLLQKISSRKLPIADYHFFILKHSRNLGLFGQSIVKIPSYPRPELAFSILTERSQHDADTDIRARCLEGLGEYFQETENAYTFLLQRSVEDKFPHARAAAIGSIARYFKEGGRTFSHLISCAKEDNSFWPRQDAIEMLGQYFVQDHEAETLDFFLQRAVEDEVDFVRAEAIKAISKNLSTYNSEKNTIFSFLLERLSKDESPWTRTEALSVLARYFSEKTETLSLLIHHGTHDKDIWPRREAITAIGKYYDGREETLPFLMERATEDEEVWPRQAAILAIGERFLDRNGAKEFLAQRAIKDRSKWIQSYAASFASSKQE
ncbi:HEAT repeat domain-containing protein [Hyphococcus flavus]|uniref:HEAT repeat domain-containing protein n=1 Tax=Hyphococcus flavus TaxID=1866326 RepID=A0AAE9ZEM3_9PROT|nr:HEAT repeat domain-containing protein [Hyphococcus flavus]WDI32360.1 HEAT repeat domain-containing protein [Hyphococcus flavus]